MGFLFGVTLLMGCTLLLVISTSSELTCLFNVVGFGAVTLGLADSLAFTFSAKLFWILPSNGAFDFSEVPASLIFEFSTVT